MNPDFIRNRITELRMKKDVSEQKMSRDLGRSDSYIHHIASGNALPSMTEFLNICDYFGIAPEYFFNTRTSQPVTLQRINEALEDMSEEDLQVVFSVVTRMQRK